MVDSNKAHLVLLVRKPWQLNKGFLQGMGGTSEIGVQRWKALTHQHHQTRTQWCCSMNMDKKEISLYVAEHFFGDRSGERAKGRKICSLIYTAYLSGTLHSQLLPCGHPAITDTRYYGQNSDPGRRGFTGDDSWYYALSLLWTLNDVLRVSTITRVDCFYNEGPN